jgi:hypothetical protein
MKGSQKVTLPTLMTLLPILRVHHFNPFLLLCE